MELYPTSSTKRKEKGMSKGCLISDLDALRTDYSYKMSIFIKKVRDGQPMKERDYRRYKALYETYRDAYNQIDNLLKDISRGIVELRKN